MFSMWMCELALNFTTKLATTQLWHTRDSSPISLPLMFETKSEETWGGNFKTEHAHVLQRYVYDLFVRGNATRRASALCCRFRLLATSSRRTQHISGVCVLFFLCACGSWIVVAKPSAPAAGQSFRPRAHHTPWWDCVGGGGGGSVVGVGDFYTLPHQRAHPAQLACLASAIMWRTCRATTPPSPQSRHRSKFLGERLSVLACLRHAENSAERAA